jgi:glycerol-3-phosphate dehydrogenase
VVNAAGPWCRELAQRFDQDHPRLLRRRLLLFNVLFRRRALSECALALTPRRGPSHTYFVHNWQGRMLAGTGEALLDDERTDAAPRPEETAAFIADLNEAVPELSLQESDIEAVYAGILPATVSGRLAAREVILDHGALQGPAGLYSVSGVKYTTSRLVAAKALKRIFPAARPQPLAPPAGANSGRWFFAYDWEPPAGWSAESLRELVEQEAVVHLDDLVFRRSGLGENVRRARELLPRLRPLFPWSDLRWQQECERVLSRLRGRA